VTQPEIEQPIDGLPDDPNETRVGGGKGDEPIETRPDRSKLDRFRSKIDDGRGARVSRSRAKDPDDPQGVREVPIGSVWKHGFPIDTDEQTAIDTATAAARTAGYRGRLLGDPEIVATDEHVKNGEFLIKLTFGVEPVRQGEITR